MARKYRSENKHWVHGSLTECGERWLPHTRLAKSRDEITCPKCSARVFRLLIDNIEPREDRPEFGSQLSESDRGYSYRSIRQIIFKGQLYGWIAMENGWGKPWEIWALPTGGMWHNKQYVDKATGDFWSAEAALAAVPDLIERGHLWTQTGRIERDARLAREREERLEGQRQREAELVQIRKDREERRRELRKNLLIVLRGLCATDRAMLIQGMSSDLNISEEEFA